MKIREKKYEIENGVSVNEDENNLFNDAHANNVVQYIVKNVIISFRNKKKIFYNINIYVLKLNSQSDPAIFFFCQ